MKKKIIATCLLLMAMLPLAAQQVVKYQVKRGEDLASIAAKFGMTERELKQLNDGLSYCYAGMTIEVRDHRGNGAYDDYGYDDRVDLDVAPSAVSAGDPDAAEAQRLEEAGNYKQAVKRYSRAIDRNPSVDLLFSRGVCYFEMKKWKDAIADFERVSRSRDCPIDLRNACDDYLDEAYARRDEARERRVNTWTGIVAGAVAIGAVADALSSGSSKSDKSHTDAKKASPGNKSGQVQKSDKSHTDAKKTPPGNKSGQVQKSDGNPQKQTASSRGGNGRPQGGEARKGAPRNGNKEGGQRRPGGKRDGNRQ